MANDVDKRLMKQRSEALTHLYLTEDGNVRLIPGDIEEYPFDYLVRVRDDTRRIIAQFGIVVVGLLQNKRGNDKTELKLPNVKERRPLAECNLPVCQFVFFMHGDQGYYRWLREPVLDSAHKLQDNPNSIFHRLEPNTRREIFALAQAWYISPKPELKSGAVDERRDPCYNTSTEGIRKGAGSNMGIHLSPEDENYLRAKVENGECNSVSEVVSVALQLLRAQDELQQGNLEKLRQVVQVGVEQLDTGQYTTYDAQALKERFEQIKAGIQSGTT